MVSQELIRVAVLWHEMWHEGLEEASRLYFGDHNIEGMLSTLRPLHQIIKRVKFDFINVFSKTSMKLIPLLILKGTRNIAGSYFLPIVRTRSERSLCLVRAIFEDG